MHMILWLISIIRKSQSPHNLRFSAMYPKIIHYVLNHSTLAMITVLAGGTGSIKLIRGLASQFSDITVVSNVADNIWLYGLYICPDIDTVIYGLANILDLTQGWGIKNDSFECLRQMEMLGEQTWFKLGDKDLAMHLLRTNMLKSGKSLSYITERIRDKYAVSSIIIPATDDPVETKVLTDKGEMHIQEFWVKHRARPPVVSIRYEGAERARINPKVIQAIRRVQVNRYSACKSHIEYRPDSGHQGIQKSSCCRERKNRCSFTANWEQRNKRTRRKVHGSGEIKYISFWGSKTLF